MPRNFFLVICPILPTAFHAGGQRIIDIYKNIKKKNKDSYLILILNDKNIDSNDIKIKNLYQTFNEIFFINDNNLKSFIFRSSYLKSINFNVIDLQYTSSGKYISLCRKLWPSSKIILNVMESQIRSLSIFVSNNLYKLLLPWRSFLGLLFGAVREYFYVLLSDQVITVSNADKKYIQKFFSNKDKLINLVTCISLNDYNTYSLKKKPYVIVFFAYFKSKTNEDALMWFCEKVHPIILNKIPNYRFKVVGYGLDKALIQKLNIFKNVDFIGQVENISKALNNTAVGIAPAIGGSGVRGKIHQYAFFEIPCVASPIASESLSYEHNESILIAKNHFEFAEFCIKLLSDKIFYKYIAINAKNICLNNYIWDQKEDEIKKIYDL